MTVTFEPSLDQTEDIFGTSLISSAPVESTILPIALSTGTGGSGVTSEPVAMTMFFVTRPSLPPSLRATDTVVGFAMDPYYNPNKVNFPFMYKYS
jgi:hypothetical protein